MFRLPAFLGKGITRESTQLVYYYYLYYIDCLCRSSSGHVVYSYENVPPVFYLGLCWKHCQRTCYSWGAICIFNDCCPHFRGF